jgi:hypothetical protein
MTLSAKKRFKTLQYIWKGKTLQTKKHKIAITLCEQTFRNNSTDRGEQSHTSSGLVLSPTLPRLMHTLIDQIVSPNCVNFSRKFRAKLASGPSEQKSELLIVVKTNLAEVYTTIPESKLILHSKHSFVARIESIEVVAKPSADSDWIFITFPECKVLHFLLSLSSLAFPSL